MKQPTHEPLLTLSERDSRWKCVREKMASLGIECLIIDSSDGFAHSFEANVRYLANIGMQGFMLFPLDHEPALFPFIWHEIPAFELERRGFWVAEIKSGGPCYSKPIAEYLQRYNITTGTLGIVDNGGELLCEGTFPHQTLGAIKREFSQIEPVNATSILETARAVKSAAEVKCLTKATIIGQQVIDGVKKTIHAGQEEWRVTDSIMHAMYEAGGEPGSLVLCASGDRVVHAAVSGRHPPPSHRILKEGDVILTEFSISVEGYMAQFNQPFSIGRLSSDWQSILEVAVESFNEGLGSTKPGMKAKELSEAFANPVNRAGLSYFYPAFHGLGLSAVEAPISYFPDQPTRHFASDYLLKENVVLELEPHVCNQRDMGLSIGCPILVTDKGAKMLVESWTPEMPVL